MIKPHFIITSFLLLLLLAGCRGQGATITWETASEVDTAGFNLYRSTSPEGPWQKINTQLIPPSDDPVSGGKYKFVDKSAERSQTYYYQLEEVELSGNTTRFDPIEMKNSGQMPTWLWWITGALVAIGLGWLLGSFFGKKKSNESAT